MLDEPFRVHDTVKQPYRFKPFYYGAGGKIIAFAKAGIVQIRVICRNVLRPDIRQAGDVLLLRQIPQEQAKVIRVVIDASLRVAEKLQLLRELMKLNIVHGIIYTRDSLRTYSTRLFLASISRPHNRRSFLSSKFI